MNSEERELKRIGFERDVEGDWVSNSRVDGIHVFLIRPSNVPWLRSGRVERHPTLWQVQYYQERIADGVSPLAAYTAALLLLGDTL
jgi:hypothetical protein